MYVPIRNVLVEGALQFIRAHFINIKIELLCWTSDYSRR